MTVKLHCTAPLDSICRNNSSSISRRSYLLKNWTILNNNSTKREKNKTSNMILKSQGRLLFAVCLYTRSTSSSWNRSTRSDVLTRGVGGAWEEVFTVRQALGDISRVPCHCGERVSSVSAWWVCATQPLESAQHVNNRGASCCGEAACLDHYRPDPIKPPDMPRHFAEGANVWNQIQRVHIGLLGSTKAFSLYFYNLQGYSPESKQTQTIWLANKNWSDLGQYQYKVLLVSSSESLSYHENVAEK